MASNEKNFLEVWSREACGILVLTKWGFHRGETPRGGALVKCMTSRDKVINRFIFYTQ
jgi:hypothetical protein